MATILHDDEKQVDSRIEEEYQAYKPDLPPRKEEKDGGFVVCNGPEYDPLREKISSAVKRQSGNSLSPFREPWVKLMLHTRLLLSSDKR